MNYISILSNENFEKVEPYISSVTYLAIGICNILGKTTRTIEWVKNPLTKDRFFLYSGVNAIISGATIPARNHLTNFRQYEGLVTVALFALFSTVFYIYSSKSSISAFGILRLSLFPLVIKTVIYGIHALGLKTLKNIFLPNVNKENDLEHLKFLFDHNEPPPNNIIKQKLSFLDFEDSFNPNSIKNNQSLWYFHYFTTHPSKWNKLSFDKQIIFKNKLEQNYSEQLAFFPQPNSDLKSLTSEIVKALHDQYTKNLDQWVLLSLSIQLELNKLFETSHSVIPVPDSEENIKNFQSNILDAYTKAFNDRKFSIDSFPSPFYHAFITAYNANPQTVKPNWVSTN